MISKLHINLSQGLIEVEGTEDLVRDVYRDFKDKISSELQKKPEGKEAVPEMPVLKVPVNQSLPKKTKQSPSGGAKENLETVSDLLNGAAGKKFLAEVKGYELPASHQKKVTLFIYVMQKIGVTGITVNHVYTCYRLLTEKASGNLKQTIIDAKNKNVWIINDNWSDLKTHHKGDEMVEYDLAIKEGKADKVGNA